MATKDQKKKKCNDPGADCSACTTIKLKPGQSQCCALCVSTGERCRRKVVPGSATRGKQSWCFQHQIDCIDKNRAYKNVCAEIKKEAPDLFEVLLRTKDDKNIGPEVQKWLAAFPSTTNRRHLASRLKQCGSQRKEFSTLCQSKECADRLHAMIAENFIQAGAEMKSLSGVEPKEKGNVAKQEANEEEEEETEPVAPEPLEKTEDEEEEEDTLPKEEETKVTSQPEKKKGKIGPRKRTSEEEKTKLRQAEQLRGIWKERTVKHKYSEAKFALLQRQIDEVMKLNVTSYVSMLQSAMTQGKLITTNFVARHIVHGPSQGKSGLIADYQVLGGVISGQARITRRLYVVDEKNFDRAFTGFQSHAEREAEVKKSVREKTIVLEHPFVQMLPELAAYVIRTIAFIPDPDVPVMRPVAYLAKQLFQIYVPRLQKHDESLVLTFLGNELKDIGKSSFQMADAVNHAVTRERFNKILGEWQALILSFAERIHAEQIPDRQVYFLSLHIAFSSLYEYVYILVELIKTAALR